VAAYIYKNARINPVSTSTNRIPRSTRGTTTAATTIAAKVSIISLFLDYVLCQEPAGTAAAVPVGRAGKAATGYEC
jgi:hypothetical protein